MLPRLRSCLAVAAALLGALPPGAATAAGQGDAALMVRATVLRHTTIRIAPPRTLMISEADVARGYVELAAPVEVEVQSNVREGYTLVFERRGEEVRQVHVRGLRDSGLVVGDASAMASRPAAGRGLWRELLQLRFRFDLAPHAQPGPHPWPLDISMMSL